MRNYPIYPYKRGDQSTYPDKDGSYLILLRDERVNGEFWMKSEWCSMGGYFDGELEHINATLDPNVKVLCYMQLPDVRTVLRMLKREGK